MKKFLKEAAESKKKDLKIGLPLLTLGLIVMLIGGSAWSPLIIVGLILVGISSLFLYW